jgi:hypothetical protein
MRVARLAPALALLGLGLALLVAPPAFAQVNPFGDASKTKLSGSDFKVLDEATQKLLARPDLGPGIQESWTNPETKSAGSLTVKKEFQRKGLSCVAIGYQAMPRGRPPNRTNQLNWCKTPAGWKTL